LLAIAIGNSLKKNDLALAKSGAQNKKAHEG